MVITLIRTTIIIFSDTIFSDLENYYLNYENLMNGYLLVSTIFSEKWVIR